MVPTLNEEQLKRAEKALGKLEPQQPEPRPQDKTKYHSKKASSFGDNNTKWLWNPYLPIGDYSVVMGDGGTGKTVFVCGVAANISTGNPLPGQLGQAKPQNVLIISAEDSGEVLKERLELSGADTDRIYILDRDKSIGLSFADDYETFESAVMEHNPALVIIDPWQAFLGASVDINRVNALRPVLQRISWLAKKCNCAMVLLSHVNKRAQGENANNAATGSTDFVNASRSVIRVIFDPVESDCRIAVHTKSNYASLGQSVVYRIESGGAHWEGFSPIDRAALEEAARKRKTVGEIISTGKTVELTNARLIGALEREADTAYPHSIRLGYNEFKDLYGEDIFGTTQPKRAITALKGQLERDGYFVVFEKQDDGDSKPKPLSKKVDGSKQNAFEIQRMEDMEDIDL